MEENESENSSWKYLLTPAEESKEGEQESIHVHRRNPMNSGNHSRLRTTESIHVRRRNAMKSGNHSRLKTTKSTSTKVKCPNCDAMFYPKTLLVHKRYFCNKEPPKNLEFKLINNHLALCLKCNRPQHHDTILLHSKYTCKSSYVRCFYCPAIFKGHISKRSQLMTHIKYSHSKGMYEVSDLVSKLNPEDIHTDKNGVVYTSFQTSEVEKQVGNSAGCHGNEIEYNFNQVEESEDLFKKAENPNPVENFLLKRKANDMLNDSRFHCASANSSFSNIPVKKIFIPPEHKMDPKDQSLSFCPKCSKLICSAVKRIHRKYFCGKTPDSQLGWKIDEASPSGAVCLKCGKNGLKPHLIEFHVGYICGKIPISVQCFYCDQFYDNYTRLTLHMKNIHKREHERLDLLSVLPPAEDASSENTADEGSQRKIVKVCFGGLNNILQNWSGPAVYTCFYCTESFAYVFESLDHMEEEHSMKHNTYDVLRNHFASY